MRIEANLSQGGLASLLPDRPHLSWISKVEKDQIDLKVSDLRALADALNVTARWLVDGDEGEDGEFLARLRGMEPLIDDGGQRTVLAVAVQQVEETRLRNISRSLSADEAELGQSTPIGLPPDHGPER